MDTLWGKSSPAWDGTGSGSVEDEGEDAARARVKDSNVDDGRPGTVWGYIQ